MPYTIVIYPLVFLVLVPALVGVAPARLRHPGRLRPRPVRLADAGAAGRDHRHRRDHAVHRAAAGRHRGGAQDDGRHRRHALARHLPIIIAFAILAAYTYQSGLRAPALIAFVKDTLIYIVILVAVIYLPYKLGGWGDIFDAADAKFDASPNPTDGILLNANNQLQYVTLAFGSALALFLYPHSITGVLASRNRDVIKRNMSALPAYSLLLGLIALLGYMAIAAGVKPLPGATAGTSTATPWCRCCSTSMFPDWFAGVAFAAIGIGALVPAAIMSIAAANLFTRNIYKEYLKRDATPAQEANVSKITSLVVKVGAVRASCFLDPQFSIDLQLIGGVIILQTLPAVALGLYTRWFHRGGLIAGWVAGMGAGHVDALPDPQPGDQASHFGGSAFPLSKFGFDTNEDDLRRHRGGAGQPGRGGAGDAGRCGPRRSPTAWTAPRRTTTSPTRATRGSPPAPTATPTRPANRSPDPPALPRPARPPAPLPTPARPR